MAADRSGARVAALVVELVRGLTRLLVNVLVLEIVGTTTPSTASTPAALLERVVSEALPSSIVPRPRANDVEFTSPDIGRPVALVRVTDVGVPKTGVTRACELGSTTVPVKVGEAKLAFKLSAVVTKAVVASAVALFPADWVTPTVPVGRFGVPEKVGEARFALRSKAVCCAVDTGLPASVVLFTLPSPTIDAVIPATVPVNVGEARLAFRARSVLSASVPARSCRV